MKTIIRTVIAGGVIAAIGVIILLIGLSINGWRLENVKFTMQTFTAENENTAITIKLDTGSLKTEFYDGDRIIIEYPTAKRYSASLTESDGKVTFHGAHRSGWVQFGTVNVPETTVRLPKDVVFDVVMELNAGSANLCNGQFGDVALKLDAGAISCGDIVCKTLTCKMNAGALKIASAECEKFECKMNAGVMSTEKLTCPSTSLKLNAGAAKLGFTGTQEEYSILTDINAGSCNVVSQKGTSEKTISLKQNAGSTKLTFAV